MDAPLTLPMPLERFPSIPRELLSSELWGGSGRRYLGDWLACTASAVVPFWPDLGALWSERGLLCGGLVVSMRAGGLAGATAGELGQRTHDWFISMLSSSRQEDRDRAVETVLELAARRQLSAEHLAMAARKHVEAGDQPLGRFVRTLALVAYEGHLDCVWPALTALVMVSAGQQKLPAGMPELLATCTELWDVIPGGQRTPESVPAEFTVAVAALAEKSTTKTALEAKRLAARMGLQPSASL
ncbi:hypothetical protein [Pseudarthrobacter sp. H2]|uniref:hypothetical protein n=1 Tax=Pseudarthrobacter sp. H2 TaxID=3418415 RepID=UPI003CEA8003